MEMNSNSFEPEVEIWFSDTNKTISSNSTQREKVGLMGICPIL